MSSKASNRRQRKNEQNKETFFWLAMINCGAEYKPLTTWFVELLLLLSFYLFFFAGDTESMWNGFGM